MNEAPPESVTMKKRLFRALLAFLLYAPPVSGLAITPPRVIRGWAQLALAVGLPAAALFAFGLLLVFVPIAYRRAQVSGRRQTRSPLAQAFFAALIPSHFAFLWGLAGVEFSQARQDTDLFVQLLFAGTACLEVIVLGAAGFVALAEAGQLRKRSFWYATALISLGTFAIVFLTHAFPWSPVVVLLRMAEPDMVAGGVMVSLLLIPYLLLYGLLFLPSRRLPW